MYPPPPPPPPYVTFHVQFYLTNVSSRIIYVGGATDYNSNTSCSVFAMHLYCDKINTYIILLPNSPISSNINTFAQFNNYNSK